MDGTRGDGFAWQGSAHASASTRAATDLVIRGAIQTDIEGTWIASIRPHWSSNDATRRTLAHAPGGVWLGHEDGEYALECPTLAGIERLALPTAHEPFEVVRLAASWSPQMLCLQANEAAAAVKREATPLGVRSSWVQVGRSAAAAEGWIDADVLRVVAHGRAMSGRAALAGWV